MTRASRPERRRAVKAERKERGADEPGLKLPGVELLPDEVQRFARALEPRDRMVYFALLDGAAKPYLTFEEYVNRAHPNYVWGAHLRALARRLQDVADGLLTRLMIFMPPRHGKSELVSRIFTAYYLYRHAHRDVALTTYGAELSYDLSRDARTNYLTLGGELAGDSAAIKSWHTSKGGNLWATGAGGAATGRGFHLGVIDDPYKDHIEAASAKVRRTRWNWYKSVFRTRAAPGAAIIMLMTRWHLDDMAGNMLRDEAVAKSGWHVLDFPAEARRPIAPVEPGDVAASLDAMLEGAIDPLTGVAVSGSGSRSPWPESVTIEPDVRDDPRWLWTSRFPAAEYEAIKRELGGDSGYFWNALYQQRPVASEGGLFKREWFTPIARTKLPPMVKIIRWWDLGATEGDGKFTAGLKVGKDADGKYYILHLVHGQWHPGKRDRIIVETARSDGISVKQMFPQDPGAAGKQVAEQHVKMLSGIARAATQIETGDKGTRATLAASDASNGLFLIVAEPWAAVVVQELADFGPGADFTDIVDALSGAHANLAGARRGVFVV
jgi:predicted phage terminase large subunit-like protein